MFLSELPLVLEEIVIDYKEEMEFVEIRHEHKQTFQSTLDEINKISYSIVNGDSWRTYYEITVECYGGLNQGDTLYNSIYQLWIQTYDRTPLFTDGVEDETETIATIYESTNRVEIVINTEQYDLIDIDDAPEDYQYQ